MLTKVHPWLPEARSEQGLPAKWHQRTFRVIEIIFIMYQHSWSCLPIMYFIVSKLYLNKVDFLKRRNKMNEERMTETFLSLLYLFSLSSTLGLLKPNVYQLRRNIIKKLMDKVAIKYFNAFKKHFLITNCLVITWMAQ